MNSQPLEFTWNEAASNDIEQHLLRCDSAFQPRLSQIVEISEYAKKITERAELRECWSDGNLMGLAAAYMNDFVRRQAFLTNLSVDARFGRRGVGRQLLADSINRAAGYGFLRYNLQAYDSNSQALLLYESMGFAVTQVHDGIMDLSRQIGPH